MQSSASTSTSGRAPAPQRLIRSACPSRRQQAALALCTSTHSTRTRQTRLGSHLRTSCRLSRALRMRTCRLTATSCCACRCRAATCHHHVQLHPHAAHVRTAACALPRRCTQRTSRRCHTARQQRRARMRTPHTSLASSAGRERGTWAGVGSLGEGPQNVFRLAMTMIRMPCSNPMACVPSTSNNCT